VRSSVTVETTFGASHTPTWWSCPDRKHGHDFGVRVEIEFDPNDPFDHDPEYALRDITNELDERDLNDMLAPSRPDLYGVAAFYMDRMLTLFRVIEVRAWHGLVECKLLADDVRRR
jgi:6-pyruvoyl-tetrahydropterin synthase